MLTDPSSRLVRLYMFNTNLSSIAAIALFNALVMSSKLQQLSIGDNITDEACDVIVIAH